MPGAISLTDFGCGPRRFQGNCNLDLGVNTALQVFSISAICITRRMRFYARGSTFPSALVITKGENMAAWCYDPLLYIIRYADSSLRYGTSAAASLAELRSRELVE